MSTPTDPQPLVNGHVYQNTLFGERFLQDHAGAIVMDAKVAIAELVANAHDAGATLVKITWPGEPDAVHVVADNGTGMTRQEFTSRWQCLSYNRLETQGGFAEFPPTVKGPRRRPTFGQNGKGRHAPFCFADQYSVVTTKGGQRTEATVRWSTVPTAATQVTCTETKADERLHGTVISWVAERKWMQTDLLAELLGSVFLIDPEFSIEINGVPLDLQSLEGTKCDRIPVPPYGDALVYLIDTKATNRRHNRPGVAWRVNGRLVGEPGWQEIDTLGFFMNGRPGDSKHFCFVVEADFLHRHVKANWKGFHDNKITADARATVYTHVAAVTRALGRETAVKQKRAVLSEASATIRELPTLSQQTVVKFLDDVQSQCPRLSKGELTTCVQVLAKLERSRAGYDLLDQLAACTPGQLDQWTAIMKTWTADHATAVLSELERRLGTIKRLQKIAPRTDADEVHDLLPLFANGLWMFGPEFETVTFVANRSIATVLRELGGINASGKLLNDRPDAVAIPEDYVLTQSGVIMTYGQDGFDQRNEVSHLSKLLIVELKKGGVVVAEDEMSQAKKYVRQLRTRGLISKDTAVTVYVLGSVVSDEVEVESLGETGTRTVIYPRTYDHVLRAASARTFHLHRRLEQMGGLPPMDEDLAATVHRQPAIPV